MRAQGWLKILIPCRVTSAEFDQESFSQPF